MSDKHLVTQRRTISSKYLLLKISLELLLAYGLYTWYQIPQISYYFLLSVIFGFNAIGYFLTAPYTFLLSCDQDRKLRIIESKKVLFKWIKVPFVFNNLVVQNFRLLQRKRRGKVRYLFSFKSRFFTYKLVLKEKEFVELQSYIQKRTNNP